MTIETWEERRAVVEGAGLGFAAAEEYRTFPPPEPGTDDGRHAADAARALLPLLADLDPAVVVSDILTLAPTLAAEAAGVPLATLVPHIYPVVEPASRSSPWDCGRRGRRSGGRPGGPGSGPSTSASSTAAATSTASASASAWPRSTASTAASAPSWRWSRPTRSSSTPAPGPPRCR